MNFKIPIDLFNNNNNNNHFENNDDTNDIPFGMKLSKLLLESDIKENKSVVVIGKLIDEGDNSVGNNCP